MTGEGARRSLRDGFLESARTAPGTAALATADRAWTYGELDDTARRWAAALLDTLGRTPERVGVFGHRSEASYAGVLAALVAGAAFVPLTPTMPPARTRAMVRAGRLDALIADRAALPQLPQVLEDDPVPILLPNADASETPVPGPILDRADLATVPPLRDLASSPPGAMAYLLFTSGSTGTPKGVPIANRNVTHLLDACGRRYGFTADDRLSQTFEQTFDLSIFDLFMAWEAGACVCVPGPTDLVSPFRYVERHGITAWFSVPSLATLLLRKRLLAPGSMPGLRWSLFCGEALSREAAEAWQAAAPASTLENLYGPTECTIACTAYRWDPERSPSECVDGFVPIGRPLDGIHALVVDEHLEPVDDGTPGELAIAGPQTFEAYWDDPEVTRGRFFTRVGRDGKPLRYYRTGDRVTRVPAGDHLFHGRIDHQVQVLGHRVELGEIEAALIAQPDVAEAAAVPMGMRAGSADGIVAFVTGSGPDPDAVGAAVRNLLPAYMAPRSVQVLDELPRTTNGKVDRQALGRMLEGDSGRAAPR